MKVIKQELLPFIQLLYNKNMSLKYFSSDNEDKKKTFVVRIEVAMRYEIVHRKFKYLLLSLNKK